MGIGDDDVVISAGSDQSLNFWNVNDGTLLHRIADAHENWIGGVGYVPSMDAIITCSGDRSVKLWDCMTRTCRRKMTGHKGCVRGLACVRDHFFATASYDSTVMLWDGRRGWCVDTFRGHSGDVMDVTRFGRGSQLQVASCSSDGAIYVWERDHCNSIRSFVGHEDAVYCLAMDADRNCLLSGSKDSTLRLWPVGEDASGSSSSSKIVMRHANSFDSILVFPGTFYVVAGDSDGNVVMLDLRMPSKEIREFRAHGERFCVWKVVQLNENSFATACGDSTIKCWNLKGSCLKEWKEKKNVYSLCSLTRTRLRNLSYGQKLGDRMEFLIGASLFDFEIRMREERRLRCWKSCLTGSRIEDLLVSDHVDLDLDVNVDEVILVKLCLGRRADIPPKHLLDYFLLFRHLKMPLHMGLVVKELSKVRSLVNLLYLFVQCRNRLERFDDAEPDLEFDFDARLTVPMVEFQSSFSLAIFNAFYDRKDEIEENPKLFATFERFNILGKLKSFHPSPVSEHADYLLCGDPAVSFPSLASSSISTLYYSRESTQNLVLRTADGESVPVHVEILLLRSEFFQNMIRFGGAESESLRTDQSIDVHLPSIVLEQIIEFCYRWTLSCEQVEELFDLHKHASMHGEVSLKRLVVRRLKSETRTIGVPELEDVLMKKGHLLEDQDDQESLVSFWCSTHNIKRDELLECLRKARETHEFFQIVQRQSDEIETLKSQLERERSVREQEREEYLELLGSQASRISRLEQLLEQSTQEEEEGESSRNEEL